VLIIASKASHLIDMLSRNLRADVKFDKESDSKLSFFWKYGIDSWASRCENSRSPLFSSNIFRLGGRGKVEDTALTIFDDLGGRGGGKFLFMTGDGGRRIGASFPQNSVSDVLSEMFVSSARDLET
jgi:hypothetical protein